MAKIVLNDLASTYDITLINDNFSKIESEFQNKVLYRNNPEGEPNTLQTDVDANGQRIYNLPEPTTSGEPLRLEDLENVAGNLEDSQEAADTAVAAAVSAIASAASAASNASNAASSAIAAAASELDAENAASSAAGSANTATVQATASSNSAAAALVSENAAAASAAAALVSENNAADSEVAAAASAAAAAGAVTDHINDAVGAHAATAISNTPAGSIAATTVQAAINELDTEKAPLASPTFTGQASFAAGTAAAPSVKVGAEQNGLYSSATNTLDVTLGGVRQFQFSRTASAVNYFSVTGSVAGGFSNILESVGPDSNIQNLYASKGTSGHVFRTGGSGGFTQFLMAHAPSAVNYYQVQGAATAGAPVFFATGSDTNVSAIYSLKGAGNHVFYTATTTAPQLMVAHTASAVNHLQVTGSATGNAVTISTGGSDTNRSISLTAAGTGLVQITNDSLRIVTSKTPASATAAGTAGQIAWDANYVYVCTATNTWKRSALTTW